MGLCMCAVVEMTAFKYCNFTNNSNFAHYQSPSSIVPYPSSVSSITGVCRIFAPSKAKAQTKLYCQTIDAEPTRLL